MPLRVTRSATIIALAVSFGLACLPACKKTKPTQADSNSGSGAPTPSSGSNIGGGRDPYAPRSPVFGQSSPSVATHRIAAENDMKQIVLALQLFHDAMGALPAGYADKDGKPGLSWRVAILPYIEQGALFNQFKLDEAWDSENNKKLISKMPTTFAPPRTSTNGYTFYRGFTGPNTWLPPLQQAARPGQPLMGVKLGQITDGTSSTILVAEAFDPVIWTKPDEVVFDPNNPPKLGGVFDSGIVVGLADGSVRFLKKSISPKTLANAIQINDGKPVNFDE